MVVFNNLSDNDIEEITEQYELEKYFFMDLGVHLPEVREYRNFNDTIHFKIISNYTINGFQNTGYLFFDFEKNDNEQVRNLINFCDTMYHIYTENCFI